MSLIVARAGFQTTIQDLGRIGFRQFGVSSGGALDLHALRIANLLAGNDESAAGLEFTQGNIRFRFEDERVISWCGGDYDVCVGSHSIPLGHSALVLGEDELSVSGPRQGWRGWLAVSGGIVVPPVLGSRSTDLRANFGGLDGRTLRDGDELLLGEQSDFAKSLIDLLNERRVSSWSSPAEWSSTAKTKPILRIVRGCDWDRFNASTHHALTSETFAVSPDSDRMGVRLNGPELYRNDEADLVSEAVAPGTVQVPPGGRPILLLGDCQTIGGYPRIAHVITIDLSIAAQLRPGDTVRFQEISLPEAHRLVFEREQELERFRIGLSLRKK
jgi:antagonist of KipI